mmetsp:Transcript_27656/g.70996  ORF Transcript_27656/g.70996 Transcript_27656/m.70996 type:complete len:267 (-) Transcript_27656:434-1234(-)
MKFAMRNAAFLQNRKWARDAWGLNLMQAPKWTCRAHCTTLKQKASQKRLMTKSPRSSAASVPQSTMSSPAPSHQVPASSMAPAPHSPTSSTAPAVQSPTSSAAPAVQSPTSAAASPNQSPPPPSPADAAHSLTAPPERCSPSTTPPMARAPTTAAPMATLLPVDRAWSFCFCTTDSTDSPFSGIGTTILDPLGAPGGTATVSLRPGLLGSSISIDIIPSGTGTTMTPPGATRGFGGAVMCGGGRILRSLPLFKFFCTICAEVKAYS